MSPVPPRKPGLLVSVRSADEAEAALAGGADLIDVKEPANGPLGAAEVAVIRSVKACVAGRVPLSAALGEWTQESPWRPVAALKLDYLKWGLAGCAGPTWGHILNSRRQLMPPSTRMVLVAYGDWERAESVPPELLARFAVQFRFRTFLMDTWGKDGSTLLRWQSAEQIRQVRGYLGLAGVAVALAGSLGPAEIERLRPIAPDWFAVRSAVCEGGRAGQVDRTRVQELSRILAGPRRASVQRFVCED